MDQKLHLLETFSATGSDGATYKVHGYEHLALDPSLTDAQEHWLPTGTVQYRLADGQPLAAEKDGALRIIGRDVRLQRRPAFS